MVAWRRAYDAFPAPTDGEVIMKRGKAERMRERKHGSKKGRREERKAE